MKVYLLELTHDYEEDGHDCLGIFSTKEKAIEHIKKIAPEAVLSDETYIEKRQQGDNFADHDYYDIHEYEIDGPVAQ